LFLRDLKSTGSSFVRGLESEGANIVSGLKSGRQASGKDDEVEAKLSKLNIKQKNK